MALGLEVRLWWGDHRLDERWFPAGRPVDFDGTLIACEPEGDGLSLRFVDGGQRSVSLREGEVTWLSLPHGLRLELLPCHAPAQVESWEEWDALSIRILIGVAAVASLAIISAENRGLGDSSPSLVLEGLRQTVQRTRFVPPPNRPAGTASASPPAPGPEGRAGRPRSTRRTLARAGPPNAAEYGLALAQKVISSVGRTGIFSTKGMGAPLTDAVKGVVSSTRLEGLGSGGKGLRGDFQGGGGVGPSIGLEGVSTRGRAGDGTASRGEPQLRKGPTSFLPEVNDGPVTVSGSLDKELVRQVIRRHRNQLRYCYELALVRNPALGGKLSVSFTISDKGEVTRADEQESTIKSSELQGCVLSRIRTWRFPSLNGGGQRVVRYPFLFRPGQDH
jgi:hypothetical protein